MKKALLGISLALAITFPLLAQDKEADRVENSGKVMKEILNAPDGKRLATPTRHRTASVAASNANGLFAGISLAGSTLRPDNSANKNLYGKEVSAKSIVFDKAVPVPDSAKGLLATLQKASPVNKSSGN